MVIVLVFFIYLFTNCIVVIFRPLAGVFMLLLGMIFGMILSLANFHMFGVFGFVLGYWFFSKMLPYIPEKWGDKIKLSPTSPRPTRTPLEH